MLSCWIRQAHLWDIASGKEVLQVAASKCFYGAGAVQWTNHHLVTASGDELLITETVSHEGAKDIEEGAALQGAAVHQIFAVARRDYLLRC